MSQNFLGFETEKCWDYENGFYLTSDVTRLAKMLAHYELYKRIIGLPGHFVECGVYKSASFLRFATFREVLESPYSRKMIALMLSAFFRKATKTLITRPSFADSPLQEGTASAVSLWSRSSLTRVSAIASLSKATSAGPSRNMSSIIQN